MIPPLLAQADLVAELGYQGMGGIARIAAICLLTLASSAAVRGAPLAVFQITEASIAQMRERYPLASVEVNDPTYKKKQRYQGFWLNDVLKDLSHRGHPESDVYVRFRCKDGYLPSMPLARALGGKGLIAIRDESVPQGEDWLPLPGHGTSIPAPSYLVWVSPPGEEEKYPWPFQMVAIELVTSSEAVADLAPHSGKPGHDLFVKHCLKCHAINGAGGTLGPELNSPCSVTEYWDPRLLKLFISTPGSIRAGAKMPNFNSLPEKDILAIVDYLHFMAGQKKSGAVCP